jgi:S-adenosylmethionine:tRNA ribosyltransferase-isomerase
MGTPTKDFDYHLPKELIAQHSVEPRDHSRLMVLDRKTGERQHKRFYDLVDDLRQGDVLVMNDTKVFRARLTATVSDKTVELFLLRPRGDIWDVLMKPGKFVRSGEEIRMGEITGRIVSKSDVLSVVFSVSDEELILYANVHGEIPVPPYVRETPSNMDQYQTVYAREVGSVAAPTAGFHFTQELLDRIQAKGIEIHFVTLHVGIGTFRPMKTQTIEEHQMHSEFVTITPETAQAINRAKQESRRVIAVGTTTVRTLEGVAKQMITFFNPGGKKSTSVLPVNGFAGDVNLFVTPGFEFKIVDALITNFHLPKSTLLVLVSAFARLPSVASAKEGRESVLAAYQEAIRVRYRLFSFGDAMFIR